MVQYGTVLKNQTINIIVNFLCTFFFDIVLYDMVLSGLVWFDMIQYDVSGLV